MDCKDGAKLFKLLGDETRLQIFEMLKQGEMCACKILEAFEITQPTLSYHLNMLTECGIINSRKDGKWNFYSIKKEALEFLSRYFNVSKKCCEGSCGCKPKKENE